MQGNSVGPLSGSCSNWLFNSTLCPTSMTDGAVRLVNGSGPAQGRLEIFHNGVWGTVCDDSWTDANANVVCRMLGFRAGTFACCAASGSGTGQIWLDDVSCTGSESTIVNCMHAAWGTNNCSHSEDVSVTCSP